MLYLWEYIANNNMYFKTYLAAALSVAMLLSCSPRKANIPAYLDPNAPMDERVEDALSRMTTEEKVAMTHAQSKFSSTGVPRLGFPDIWCTDGPHGIRPDVKWDEWIQAGNTNDSCTAFPALTALAATWNEELGLLYGKSIGEEASFRGKSVILGPGVNINRSPLNGRSFEYLGEDPYLSSRMVVPYVQGVQSQGVAACVKHFALNNQEINRFTTNVIVDDRTLYEIYLPAFKAAVEGGAWAVMGSYNLYQDHWNCHNKRLLCDILKGEWGFDGVVISDWGGTHITDEAVHNGLDMEFGSWTNGTTEGKSDAYSKYYLSTAYLDGIREGRFGTEELDDKVRRILRLEYRTNLSPDRSKMAKFTCPEHYEAARKIGDESIVLLKNEGGVLPIKDAHKILVVGENAIKMMTVGGGSSNLKVKQEISPLDGIKERFGGSAEIVFARGYLGAPTAEQDGVTAPDISDPRTPQELIAEAVDKASDADYVIFVGGLNKSWGQDSESADRTQYGLPYGQDAVIDALAEVSDKLVVVNISGNAVAMPWAAKVPAILQDWYLGSEAGRSLADVLSGDVNPSGKLPMTIGRTYEDYPIKTAEQYPGVDNGKRCTFDDSGDKVILDETYSEGIFVGYRWFQKQEIPVSFPFGHGLSYTTFEYSSAEASPYALSEGGKTTVSLRVKNTGAVAGAEVVQLYISDPECSVERPVRELKGFKKVFLQPGEEKFVEFDVDTQALSFFDAEAHAWKAEKGKFTAEVGSSSEDIRTRAEILLR